MLFQLQDSLRNNEINHYRIESPSNNIIPGVCWKYELSSDASVWNTFWVGFSFYLDGDLMKDITAGFSMRLSLLQSKEAARSLPPRYFPLSGFKYPEFPHSIPAIRVARGSHQHSNLNAIGCVSLRTCFKIIGPNSKPVLLCWDSGCCFGHKCCKVVFCSLLSAV